MKIKTSLILAVLAIGGSVAPAFADNLITWQLNGTGTGGGIAYADGSTVSGSVSWDLTTSAWYTGANTITVTDPNWNNVDATAPSGCSQAAACTGSMQPGTSWYIDPYVSSSTELLMVNVDPAGSTDLTGASYFSMVASQVFDGSDYPGGYTGNTGTGNPAAQYNEMLTDANNGIGLPTFAGTCLDSTCDQNDGSASGPPPVGAPHEASPIMSYQGTDAALAMSSCPADNTPGDYTCTSGQDGASNNYASAYFSTLVPAGPPPVVPGSAPEPSTFVLLGGSLLMVGMRWRKVSAKK